MRDITPQPEAPSARILQLQQSISEIRFCLLNSHNLFLQNLLKMQLIRLVREDHNFFCPATGKQVFQEDGASSAPSVRGSWDEYEPSEPQELAETLKPLWQKYLEEKGTIEGGIDVAAFIAATDIPGWVAFEIAGTNWQPTTWTVLDLN